VTLLNNSILHEGSTKCTTVASTEPSQLIHKAKEKLYSNSNDNKQIKTIYN